MRVAVVLADEDIHDSGIHVHPNYETKIYKVCARNEKPTAVVLCTSRNVFVSVIL